MIEDVPCPPLLPPLVPPGEDAEDDDGHDHSDKEGEAETNRQEDPCLSLDLLAMFDEALTPDIVTTDHYQCAQNLICLPGWLRSLKGCFEKESSGQS